MTYEPQRADQLTAAPGVTRQRGWLRGKRLSSRRDLLSVRYKHPWARAVLTSFARQARLSRRPDRRRRHDTTSVPANRAKGGWRQSVFLCRRLMLSVTVTP